jgi:hypothetical protein
MPGKKPPYLHREMARAIFNFESNRHSLATWLKIEAYTLFFTVLPKLITGAVWIVILSVILWAVTLI